MKLFAIKKSVFLSLFLSLGAQASDITEIINISSLVSNDRQNITIIANSKVQKGLVCDGLKYTTEIENPSIYMQVGEVFGRMDGIFLYPKFSNKVFKKDDLKKQLMTINAQSNDQLIIRSMHMDLKGMSCRKANFNDYCQLAQKDQHEKLSLGLLGIHYKKSSCKTLARKLKRKKRLNLNTSHISDFRFLKYLRHVRSVSVRDTFKDRSGYLKQQNRIRVRGDLTQQDNMLHMSVFEIIEKFGEPIKSQLEKFVY